MSERALREGFGGFEEVLRSRFWLILTGFGV